MSRGPKVVTTTTPSGFDGSWVKRLWASERLAAEGLNFMFATGDADFLDGPSDRRFMVFNDVATERRWQPQPDPHKELRRWLRGEQPCRRSLKTVLRNGLTRGDWRLYDPHKWVHIKPRITFTALTDPRTGHLAKKPAYHASFLMTPEVEAALLKAALLAKPTLPTDPVGWPHGGLGTFAGMPVVVDASLPKDTTVILNRGEYVFPNRPVAPLHALRFDDSELYDHWDDAAKYLSQQLVENQTQAMPRSCSSATSRRSAGRPGRAPTTSWPGSTPSRAARSTRPTCTSGPWSGVRRPSSGLRGPSGVKT